MAKEQEDKKTVDLHKIHDEIDSSFKLWKDETANERYLNRSRRIRQGCYEFLLKNLGVLFDDTEDVAIQAANYCRKYLRGSPASSVTTRRWIIQFCGHGGDFKALNSPAGVIFELRADEKT